MHHTPTYACSLKPGRAVATLTDKKLRRAAHRSIQGLERHSRLDQDVETKPAPFVWTKPADEILDGPAFYLQRIPPAQDTR